MPGPDRPADPYYEYFAQNQAFSAVLASLLKVFGDKMIVFTDYFHILIYSLETGELLKVRVILKTRKKFSRKNFTIFILATR